jgi:hypothetical protein
MNRTIETLHASIHHPAKMVQTLTVFGFSGTDKFAELNLFAGLAAMDNSAHHFSTLANSKSMDDLLELHIQSLLPAAESAKAYIGQMLAFSVATSREFEHLVDGHMSSVQDQVFGNLFAGLSKTEESGIPGVTTIKDTRSVT